MSDPLQEEVDQNYQAFKARLAELVQSHPGKFALMRHGAIVEFFDTPRDAHVAGRTLFPDELFSVQEVTEAPVDLGYFSHAVPQQPL